MLLEKIIARLRYPLSMPNLSKSTREQVLLLLKKIIEYDVNEKTVFEFSIKTNNGKIDNSFRVVNYVDYEKDRHEYGRRIDLIEKLLGSVCPTADNGKVLEFFRKKWHNVVPIFIGIESDGVEIFLKLYLNLHIFNKKNEKMVSEFLRLLSFCTGIRIPAPNRGMYMLGISFDKNGLRDECKIYYDFKKNIILKKDLFTEKERSRFEYLKNNNEYAFSSIIERCNNGQVTSRKIDVALNDGINILKNFLDFCGIDGVEQELRGIMGRTNGKLRVVSIEKNALTFYVDLLGYGRDNFDSW